MNTITPNLANSAAGAGYQQQLGRSLIALSANAQPATTLAQAEAEADDSPAPTNLASALLQVAQQNQFSALADSAAATAANQSAAGLMAAQPPAASAAQANLSADSVLNLLQD